MIAIVAVLAMASACSSGSSTAKSSATTTTTVNDSIASMLKPGDKAVALGSSFASGFGIPVQSTNCGRSSRDYGALVAQRFHLAFTDATCGGAEVADILDRSQNGHPPQIDAVTPDTKLVTVTIGGNDIGYTLTAFECGNRASVCKASRTLASNLVRLRASLQRMVRALQAAAPSATIVFVADPREVPAGNCPALSFTDSEAAIVRDMGAKLEQVFVDVFKNSSVVFVDTYSAPGDHTACAPASEAWMAGHVAKNGATYHPTALGHVAMARLIIAALERTKS